MRERIQKMREALEVFDRLWREGVPPPSGALAQASSALDAMTVRTECGTCGGSPHWENQHDGTQDCWLCVNQRAGLAPCPDCVDGQVETPLEDVIGWVVERVDHDEDCSKPTRQGVRDCSCGLDELLALVQSEGETT
jgi:hypothetical protein